MDKILRFFGLIRISQAKEFNQKTLNLYYRMVCMWAKEDFGVDANPHGSPDQLSDECFDKLLEMPDGKLMIGCEE